MSNEPSRTTAGMSLAQLINMLTAVYEQGAREVRIAQRTGGAYGTAAPVDWLSQRPVDGVVYIGCSAVDWTPMGNDALESLDW